MISNRTSKFFDSYAYGFDAIYGNKNNLVNNIINRLFRKSIRLRFERTIEGCLPIDGRSVLDIGCGPGHYGINLALLGASKVCGLDFAESMINLARQYAERAGVLDKCEFIQGDFMSYESPEKFDYIIAMGFMDYIENQLKVIEKIMNYTRLKAFIGFPADGGFLAWQRKIRYKWKCPLFMYDEKKIKSLLENFSDIEIKIARLDRDFFVMIRKNIESCFSSDGLKPNSFT